MSDPTRQPCAGTIRTTANCANVVEGGDVIYKNVSTMKDELDADVAPFERWGQYSDACATEYIDCRELGEGAGQDKFHCFSVLTDDLVLESLPPDTELGDNPTVKNGNTFEQTESKTPSVCGNIYGVKIVDAIKNWHGAFPFSHDENGIDCGFPWKKWNSETNTYDFHETDIGGCVPNRTNVKYLSCRRTVETSLNMVSYLDGIKYESIYTYTSDVTRTIEVNSGVVLMTKHTYEETGSVDPEHGVYFGNIRTQPYRKGFFIENIEHNRCGWGQVFNVGDPDNPALLTNDPDLSEYDSGVYGVITVNDVFRSDTELRYEKSWSATDSGNGDPRDAGSGSLKIKITLFDPYTTNDVLAHAENLASEWHLGGLVSDHLWRRDEQCYEAVEVMRDEKSAVSPLDYLVVEVQDLSIWPLDPEIKRDWVDDAVYYWPYYPPTNATEAGINALGLLSHGFYTGKIIGSPLPLGYGVSVDGSPRGSFDHYFARWQKKYCPASYSCQSSDIYRGMWTPAYIPENAQRWTRHEYFVNTPSRIYPCSFVRAGTDGVHLRKMVQTIVPRPAYDFTRPHTADRYLLDQPASPTAVDKIYYVSSVAGSVVTLISRDATAPSSLLSDFAVNDLVVLPEKDFDGVPLGVTPGVYPVTAVSSTTVTVGTIVRQLPTGFTNDSRDADQAFGKIRFKDAPGFSGRLAVTAAAADGNTLLTYADSPYIQTGDLVDLWDGSSWDSNGGAGYALTRLTDTTATISGAHLDTTHIVPHAYAVTDPETSAPLSGQRWWFCGIEQTYKGKGDYVVRNWTLNTDSGLQEPNTIQAFQRCLPLGIPCSTKVAGHSPNETNSDFINGKIEAHPTTINNGNEWLGAVEQHMVDPLWQTPHKPGGPDWDDILWSRDDGSCREDETVDVNSVPKTQMYYRMPDFYEARISVPGGYGPANNKTAPGLPAGIEPLDTAQPPLSSGILSKPCTEGSSFYYDEAMPTMETPWGIYYRQLGCVCGNPVGRFHEQYQANGIGC